MIFILLLLTQVFSYFEAEKWFTVKNSIHKNFSRQWPKKKILDLQEFFNAINVSNKRLVVIKENIVNLLKELVRNKVIHNPIEILFKNSKKAEVLIEFLTASDITRRIKYLKFTENIEI